MGVCVNVRLDQVEVSKANRLRPLLSAQTNAVESGENARASVLRLSRSNSLFFRPSTSQIVVR
jgi:hypothetical protein